MCPIKVLKTAAPISRRRQRQTGSTQTHRHKRVNIQATVDSRDIEGKSAYTRYSEIYACDIVHPSVRLNMEFVSPLLLYGTVGSHMLYAIR